MKRQMKKTRDDTKSIFRFPRSRILMMLKKCSRLFPDKTYLSLFYRLDMGKQLNWGNPKRYTEKLQWLKLYNRKPEYTQMVDKYAVKEYVAKIIGKEYIIPTLGVWDRVEDINFEELPNQFVLKTTHGGGGSGVVICNDKSVFNYEEAQKRLSESLDSDLYCTFREWPYKDVPRRIIAEQFLADESGTELKDYKFFCFNGVVKCFKVDFDRQSTHKANYYTPNWDLMPFGEEICPPDYSKKLSKPVNFEQMLSLASRLSRNIPFVRVDFYNVHGKIYFGEITFFPAAGFGRFTPEEWDEVFGSWITLPSTYIK